MWAQIGTSTFAAKPLDQAVNWCNQPHHLQLNYLQHAHQPSWPAGTVAQLAPKRTGLRGRTSRHASWSRGADGVPFRRTLCLNKTKSTAKMAILMFFAVYDYNHHMPLTLETRTVQASALSRLATIAAAQARTACMSESQPQCCGVPLPNIVPCACAEEQLARLYWAERIVVPH
jgi:hypothetical protein